MSAHGLSGRAGTHFKQTVKKATVFYGLVAFGLGAPLGNAAQAACAKMMEIKVQEWTGDIINIVPWVGTDEGIFRKHCVDLKFVQINSGPAALSATVGGTIQFHSGGPDGVIRARSRGLDLKIVANMYAAQWSALVARNGLQLPHAGKGYPEIMHDLVGKKIGVTVLGGTTEAFVRSLFEGAKLNGSSATYISVGGVTTAIPALRNNVVDAAMMFGTGPDLAEGLGAGKIIVDLRKRGVGPNLLTHLWGATLSWSGYGPYIEKHQKAVAAFASANNEAIAWATDPKNRSEVIAIVKKHMPLPSALSDPNATLKRIVDNNVAGLRAGVPKDSIEGWNKYLLFLKQIKQPIGYDQLVWSTGRR